MPKTCLFAVPARRHTFTGEPVSDEQVKTVFALAKWAPTSMNHDLTRSLPP
jgi:nitroreductase